MRKALTLWFLLAALPTSVAAQGDTITWDDGTTIKCEIVSFDAKTIEYKVKGRKESAEAHRVRSIELKEAREDIYNRCSTPEDYLTAADEQFKANKLLPASYGCWKAVELFLADGKDNSGITVLDDLNKKAPNSPWTPKFFEIRARIYLGMGGKKPRPDTALKVAESYEKEAISRNWSRGYEQQAKFFMAIAEVLGGKLTKEVVIERLNRVLAASNGTAPFVYNECQVFLADFHRRNKGYAKAAEAYEELLKRPGLDQDVLGRAYLGLGYIQFEKGVTDKDKEAFHQAYLYFLRVYLLAKEASPELVAEALYNAAHAVDSWGGIPTGKWEAARLRGRLRTRSPWKETSWAKKR